MINVELAKELLKYLRAHPEEHDQDLWGLKTPTAGGGCHTVMCAGGTTCYLAGAVINWEPSTDGTMVADYVVSESLPKHARDGAKDMTYIQYAAQALLGLSQEDADRVFYYSDTLAQVEAVLVPLIEAAEAANKPVRHQIFADHPAMLHEFM